MTHFKKGDQVRIIKREFGNERMNETHRVLDCYTERDVVWVSIVGNDTKYQNSYYPHQLVLATPPPQIKAFKKLLKEHGISSE